MSGFVPDPPLRSQRWVATIRYPGLTGTSKNKCSVAPEIPNGVPSWPPVGDGVGSKTCQNSYSGTFFRCRGASVGIRWAIAERLCSRHAIASGRQLAPRLAYAFGVRIHKTAQNSNSGAFFAPRRAAGDAWERTPMPPKPCHRDGTRVGVGGMEGRKTVQNSSSGALLPRGIYLNRRGPKTGMPIGSTLIPPLPVSTLPRRRSTAPLASRGWPRPEQKHAPRSTFGEFSSPRASTTCLIA